MKGVSPRPSAFRLSRSPPPVLHGGLHPPSPPPLRAHFRLLHPAGKLEKLSLSSWLLGQVQVTIGRHHSRIRGLEIEHAISTLPIIPHFAIAILLLILPNWLGRGNKVEKACWGGGEKPRCDENLEMPTTPVEIAKFFFSNFQPTPQSRISLLNAAQKNDIPTRSSLSRNTF